MRFEPGERDPQSRERLGATMLAVGWMWPSVIAALAAWGFLNVLGRQSPLPGGGRA
ncbi:MAG: hypothetical protein AB1806_05600 [Acidobacteriota bacterium]